MRNVDIVLISLRSQDDDEDGSETDDETLSDESSEMSHEEVLVPFKVVHNGRIHFFLIFFN
jgi:hypothetical protein